VRSPGAPPRVVALGGGHGLAASLQALRRVTPHVTAVVTVADDGGSSGRLRSELGALPPGDLRMALAALAGDDAWGRTWAELLQHRFGGGGPLAGHAVGNLLLTGLAQTTGDQVTALDLAAQLVGAVGRVLPMSAVPLEIAAEVVGVDPAHPTDVRRVVGQVAVASTTGVVIAVHLQPPDPPACEEAVRAVHEADWVVLGPGSWFTSVLPHLLVPELRQALETTRARRLVALNLSEQAGETAGFSPQAHLDVLAAHAPGLSLQVVLADEAAVPDVAGLRDAARLTGAELVLAPLALGDGTARHHPERLAAAYAQVMGTGAGGVPDKGTSGAPSLLPGARVSARSGAPADAAGRSAGSTDEGAAWR
jgi:uncharacterized cofD-like protein